MTQRRAEGWAAEVTQVVGRAVRGLRDQRGLSGQQLVDRLGEYGVVMSRSGLTNLEANRRESIGVHEVYALAAVLGVAPIRLLVPDFTETIELLPDRPTDGTRLALWIAGLGLPGAAILSQDGVAEQATYAESAEPIDSLVLHADMVRDLLAAEHARGSAAGDRLYLRALGNLLDLRADMADQHGMAAPPLPQELDYIETDHENHRPHPRKGKSRS